MRLNISIKYEVMHGYMIQLQCIERDKDNWTTVARCRIEQDSQHTRVVDRNFECSKHVNFLKDFAENATQCSDLTKIRLRSSGTIHNG